MRKQIWIFASLGMLAACDVEVADGVDGSDGINGTDGTDGTSGTDGKDGADGTDGKDGADGSAFWSGALAPGEVAVFAHGLEDGVFYYEAQFIKDNRIYDVDAYAEHFSTQIGESVPMGMALDEGYYSSERDAAWLADGSLATVTIQTNKAWLTVLSAGMTTEIPVGPDTGYLHSPAVEALADGGLAVLVCRDWQSCDLELYDASLTLTAAIDGVIEGYGETKLLGLAGGGVLVTDGASYGGDKTISFYRYDSDGDALDAPEPITVGTYTMHAVVARPSGGFAIMSKAGSDDLSAGNVLTQFDEDGELTRTVFTEYGHQYMALAAAPSGNILAAFQMSSRAAAYAIIDAEGEIVSAPRLLSDGEVNGLSAVAFGSGDFFVVMESYKTAAPMTFAIDEQGAPLRAPEVVTGEFSHSDRGLVALPFDDESVATLAGSYDSRLPPQLTRYTRGSLPVEILDSGAVQITNHTPETLNITLAVHQTPAN